MSELTIKLNEKALLIALESGSLKALAEDIKKAGKTADEAPAIYKMDPEEKKPEEPVKKPEEPEEPEVKESKIDLSTLRKDFAAISSGSVEKRPQLKELLAEFGAKNISGVDPKDIDAIYEKLMVIKNA